MSIGIGVYQHGYMYIDVSYVGERYVLRSLRHSWLRSEMHAHVIHRLFITVYMCTTMAVYVDKLCINSYPHNINMLSPLDPPSGDGAEVPTYSYPNTVKMNLKGRLRNGGRCLRRRVLPHPIAINPHTCGHRNTLKQAKQAESAPVPGLL